MSKENLTELEFEPETSGLTYHGSYQLSYPSLYWRSPKLSTIFARGGVPVISKSQTLTYLSNTKKPTILLQFETHMKRFINTQ